MPRVGNEYILLVSRASVSGAFTVDVVEGIRAALKSWGAASRSSPIFALDAAKPPSLRGSGETLLCFMGPMRPEDLPTGIPGFLSFGLYNVVTFAKTARQKSALRALLARRSEVPWELWVLRGRTLVDVTVSPCLQNNFPIVTVRPLTLPAKLRSATDEYQTLVAVTKARSQPYLPEVAIELAIFEADLEEQLRMLNVHNIRKMQWLVNVNAALSRFSSQTFAGTSPILGTECHFWTHSLLGIGVASKALLSLRRQVEQSAVEAAFGERIEALKLLNPTQDKLGSISATDDWWSHAQLPSISRDAPRSLTARMPLVVYYSGRDGFKSTTFTLSAPLEVLHGANTYAWSLQTITHELSHVLVERIISAVLDGDIESNEWLAKTHMIHSGAAQPATLFARVQELFIEACMRLEWETQKAGEGEDIQVSNSDFPTIVAKHYQDVSELLAHLFDYIYFYEQNREAYIRSIWSSWDVIPNIKPRVHDYVVRSLFALQFSNLSIKKSIDVSIAQLREELTQLQRKTKDQQYIGHALHLLKQEEERFRHQLANRLFLVKFAKVALYSTEAVRAFLSKPASSSRGRKRAASLRPRVFEVNRPVQNPLAFIAEAAKHEDPSMATSLWVLTQLALAEGASDA